MKERGILFSGPMVMAILAGRKTQTRRAIKPQPPAATVGLNHIDGTTWACIGNNGPNRKCPYGVPGDRLWVRETWAVDAPLDQVRREHEDMMPGGIGHGPYFRTDPAHENSGLTWRPSIHLPRWASRITLEITDVRAERLQDISEQDAKAEGIRSDILRADDHAPDRICYVAEPDHNHAYVTARDAYAKTWNHINAKTCPWRCNPWVWALTYKRITE